MVLVQDDAMSYPQRWGEGREARLHRQRRWCRSYGVAAGRAGELAVNGGCMAILIPSLGFARFDTRGELRLAERLKDFLEENAVVWHNLPVGPRGRHPDFIVVHPANGLLVLEVKDWRLESIVSADKTKVELLTYLTDSHGTRGDRANKLRRSEPAKLFRAIQEQFFDSRIKPFRLNFRWNLFGLAESSCLLCNVAAPLMASNYCVH